MKRLFIILFNLILFTNVCFSQTNYYGRLFYDTVLASPMSNTLYGLVHLPPNYNPLNKYPVIIYIGDASTISGGLASLYSKGPLYFSYNKNYGYNYIIASYNGSNNSIVRPQDIDYIITHLFNTYSCDSTIYLYGYEGGANSVLLYMANSNLNRAYKISGVVIVNSYLFPRYPLVKNMLFDSSYFIGVADPVKRPTGRNTKALIDSINYYLNGHGKFISLSQRTNINYVFDTLFTTKIDNNTTNIYNWLLGNARNKGTNYTLPYRIKINPYGYWYSGDTALPMFTNLERYNYIYQLFDQSDIDPKKSPNTVPTSVTMPKGGLQYYDRWDCVVDLGTTYNISSIYWYPTYVPYVNDSIYIYYGSPNNWTVLYSGYAASFGGVNKWNYINTNINTRYIRVVIPIASQTTISEIVPYGVQQGTISYTTYPTITHTYPKRTFGYSMGINSTSPNTVPLLLLRNVGYNVRYYDDISYFDSAVYVHNIDSISFAFKKDSRNGYWTGGCFPYDTTCWNYLYPNNQIFSIFDSLRRFYNMNPFLSFQGNIPPDTINGSRYFYRIDTIVHRNWNKDDPSNYDRLGRMFYLIAGVFGNGNVPSSNLYQVNYPTNFNNNSMSYIEDGNEMDANWIDYRFFKKASDYFAMASEIDDGNGSPPSSRIGMKNADPNIKHVMFGTYYMDSNFVKAFNYYCYYNRPDRKRFMDVYNFHYYSYGPTGRALSPEEDSLRKKIKNYVDFIHNLDPGKEVWMTEWGYDRNGQSPLHVPAVPGEDSAHMQAYWILRALMAIQFAGVDRNNYFWLYQQANGTRFDTLRTGTFGSCALLDGYYSNVTGKGYATPMPAYWYFVSFYTTFRNYQPDTILRENPGDSIWIYRFRQAYTLDTVVEAVWCPTIINKKINNYVYKITPNTAYSIIQFKDSSYTGNIINGVSDSSGNIIINISENPIFIRYVRPIGTGYINNNKNMFIAYENNKKYKYIKERIDNE